MKKLFIPLLVVLACIGNNSLINGCADVLPARKVLRSTELLNGDYGKYTMILLPTAEYSAFYSTSKMALNGYAVPKNKVITVSKESLVDFLLTKDINITQFISKADTTSAIWYIENSIMAEFYQQHASIQTERDLLTYHDPLSIQTERDLLTHHNPLFKNSNWA